MPDPRLAPHPALLVRPGPDAAILRRACLRGELVRLVSGRYVRREHWESFDPRDQHVMLCIAAVSRLSAPVVVSHASAAAFWGLPRLGPWPAKAHVTDPRLTRGSANASSYAHAGRLDPTDVCEQSGALVTSAVRTAVDLAILVPFRQSVTALDHCLRTGLATRGALLADLGGRSSARGAVQARRAIGFADARADRAGESLSRVVMSESHLEPPDLQHRFRNPTGPDAVVDFFWAEQGIVGEFDGETKYRDSERWSGLSPADVVIREKDRENWLRRQPGVTSVVRWNWREALERGRLAQRLLDAGVPHLGASRASRAE